MKSDRSVVVLHRFGLGLTIGFEAAVSDTSGGKHPESTHQLIVRSRCLRRIRNTDKTSVWYIRSLASSARRVIDIRDIR